MSLKFRNTWKLSLIGRITSWSVWITSRFGCPKLFRVYTANESSTEFCGRLSCADMLEKCARALLFEKTQPCHSGIEHQKVPVTRSKTATIQTQITETFRTKFRKFLPFETTMTDKQNTKDIRMSSNNKDLVGYLKSAMICASSPALPTDGKLQIFNSLSKHFYVPKSL